MTNTDITPELLRAIAEWTDNRPTIGSITISRILRKEADSLEREQADEKRIDELAGIFWGASVKGPGFEPAWESVAEDAKPYYHAGIRAVLAHLEQDVVDAEVYGVRDNGDVLLTASDAASVKSVLRYLFGRNAGQPYPKADIETLKFFFWPERVAEPRTWDDLREVPIDVPVVRDVRGTEWRRTPAGSWMGEESTWVPGIERSPYAEVIADA
ncbi:MULTISPECIES: hypothetical protein [unclassified Rhodococcus (in: high G+C Gram-positive bacteria)]|uniref:hypothetical protein n=1 Tax=unclassified Rhodococcus (in: high G+C Gram-positive bacteria) TaxID=192944 RepID=UPI000926CF7D|nr:hypothetical protein [Rhodococcus sp. M8]OLL21230.1 hypothetical protein BKE56_015585 [Rhodococcus sp. M8]